MAPASASATFPSLYTSPMIYSLRNLRMYKLNMFITGNDTLRLISDMAFIGSSPIILNMRMLSSDFLEKNVLDLLF